VHKVHDLGKMMRDQIEAFFESYNEQRGKKFEVLAWRGPKEAERLARIGMKQFDKKNRR